MLRLQPESLEGLLLGGVAERYANNPSVADLADVGLADINRHVALAANSIPARVADHIRIGIDVLVDLRSELRPRIAPTGEQVSECLDAPQDLRCVDRAAKVAKLNVGVLHLK